MSAVTRSTPWRWAPAATPLRAWRHADFKRVAELLDTTLAQWAKDWDIRPEGVGPARCVPASGHAQRDAAWTLFAAGNAGAAWVLELAQGNGRLDALWTDAGQANSPAVRSVAARATEDWRTRVAAALRLAPVSDGSGPAGAVWLSWSGALIAELPGSCMVLLEAGVVRGVLGRAASETARAPLVAVTEAMATRSLRVHVELDGCDLPLGELTGLRLGDVLRLRHSVGAPARVCHAPAGPLFDGWLARSRGRRAIELAVRGQERPVGEQQ